MNESYKKVFLIIDVGTSSMRGILFTSSGEKKFTHQIKYSPTFGIDGSVTQSANTFLSTCIAISKECAEFTKANDLVIKAISITAQRSSLILANQNGEAIANVLMWQDTRQKAVCQSLSEYNGIFLEKSGSKINHVFWGAKLAWVKENQPEIFEKAEKYFNIPSFLIYQMTGNSYFDWTYGSRTNLMNILTKTWDIDLLNLLGVPLEKMPLLGAPGEMCGFVTEIFSKQTGISTNVPVVSAGGDQQCALLGLGLVHPGMVSVVLGTGGFISMNSTALPPKMSENIIYNCSAIPKQFIYETNIYACASAYEWFIKNFYSDNDYEEISKDLISQHSSGTSCTVLPYFQGRAMPDWNSDAKAIFADLTLSTTKSEMLYGLVLALFDEIKSDIELLEFHSEVRSIMISGGMTKSPILNQIQADTYGVDLSCSLETETTAQGALISATVATGDYKDMDEASKAIIDSSLVKNYTANQILKKEIANFSSRKDRLYKKVNANYH